MVWLARSLGLASSASKYTAPEWGAGKGSIGHKLNWSGLMLNQMFSKQDLPNLNRVIWKPYYYTEDYKEKRVNVRTGRRRGCGLGRSAREVGLPILSAVYDPIISNSAGRTPEGVNV